MGQSVGSRVEDAALFTGHGSATTSWLIRGQFGAHAVMRALNAAGNRTRLRTRSGQRRRFRDEHAIFPCVAPPRVIRRLSNGIEHRLGHLVASTVATGRPTALAAAVEDDA